LPLVPKAARHWPRPLAVMVAYCRGTLVKEPGLLEGLWMQGYSGNSRLRKGRRELLLVHVVPPRVS